jgi:hypothetical protein
VLTALAASAFAAESPRFEDYPVAKTFRGRPAPPVLSTDKARLFRTVLRREAADGPNFAGHFTIARWGCGAGCVAWAIIDARSGAIWFAPFTVADGRGVPPELAQHSIDFRLDSELVVANGSLDEGESAGTYYYRWRDGKLLMIHSVRHRE